MSVAEASRLTGVSQDCIWHLISSRVDEALNDQDWQGNAEARKQVVIKEGKLLRRSKTALSGNIENLKAQQLVSREKLIKEHKILARALTLRDHLSDTWNYSTKELAEEHLRSGLSWMRSS